MSDSLMAYYDPAREAVVVQRTSGSEVAVLDRDEAASLADEIAVAATGESTGYEEFLAQQGVTGFEEFLDEAGA